MTPTDTDPTPAHGIPRPRLNRGGPKPGDLMPSAASLSDEYRMTDPGFDHHCTNCDTGLDEDTGNLCEDCETS